MVKSTACIMLALVLCTFLFTAPAVLAQGKHASLTTCIEIFHYSSQMYSMRKLKHMNGSKLSKIHNLCHSGSDSCEVPGGDLISASCHHHYCRV